MNEQKTKWMLQAYRPGGQDAANPVFAEALEKVGKHPELQEWFRKERIFDLHVRTKLHDAIPMPSTLKANLLTLRKVATRTPGRRYPTWLNDFYK